MITTGRRSAGAEPGVGRDRPTRLRRGSLVLIAGRQCHRRGVGEVMIGLDPGEGVVDGDRRAVVVQALQPALCGAHEELAVRDTQPFGRVIHAAEGFVRKGDRSQ